VLCFKEKERHVGMVALIRRDVAYPATPQLLEMQNTKLLSWLRWLGQMI